MKYETQKSTHPFTCDEIASAKRIIRAEKIGRWLIGIACLTIVLFFMTGILSFLTKSPLAIFYATLQIFTGILIAAILFALQSITVNTAYSSAYSHGEKHAMRVDKFMALVRGVKNGIENVRAENAPGIAEALDGQR